MIGRFADNVLPLIEATVDTRVQLEQPGNNDFNNAWSNGLSDTGSSGWSDTGSNGWSDAGSNGWSDAGSDAWSEPWSGINCFI